MQHDSLSRVRCVRLLDSLDEKLDKDTVQQSLPYCITLCIVSALIWTWSISWVPSVLFGVGGLRSTQPEAQSKISYVGIPPSSVVVDCGSGKIAVYRFSSEQEVSKRTTALKITELIGALHDGKLDALEPVWALVDGAMGIANTGDGALVANDNVGLAPPPLFFGATGGVRAALANQELTSANIDDLSNAVSMRYSSAERVHFEVLSGAREAALELRAARFVFSDSAAVFGVQASLGVLSAGGKSCQLAWGTGDSAVTFDADLFAAQGVAEAVGEAAALQWWQEKLRSALLQARAPAKLPGPTVGITMMATAADYAGLAARVVTASEVKEGCDAFLAHSEVQDAWWASFFYDRDLVGGNPYHLDEDIYKRVAILSVTRLAIVVAEVFSEDALFYFTRARELPVRTEGTDGGLTNIEWPLGAMLSYPWD